MENRIKEQLSLFADWANPLRLYFSSLAYVLVEAFGGRPWRVRSGRKAKSAPSG
jgi:hypothetical protein